MFCRTTFPFVIMIEFGLMFSRFCGLPDLTVGGKLSELSGLMLIWRL